MHMATRLEPDGRRLEAIARKSFFARVAWRARGWGLKGLLVLAALVVVSLLVAISFCSPLRAPVQADAATGSGSWLTVRRGDFEEVCSEEGELRPAKVTTITFTDWAQLSWLVPEGTRVKKGEKVAAVDTERIEDELGENENELAQAERALAQQIQSFELEKKKFENDLENVNAALELAKLKEREELAKPLPLEREEAANLIVSAKARVAAAKEDLDAMAPLVEKGFGQRADLEEKKLAYESALVQLENAQVKAGRILAGATEIEKGKAAQARLAAETAVRIRELERDRSIMDLQAKIVKQRNWIKQLQQRIEKRREQIANSVRYAPHDGIVVYREVGWHGQKKVEVGSWVGPWSSPLDLPNYDYMKVRTQVPESVVNHLTARHGPPQPRPGTKVRVRVKTLPDRDYPAEIVWIDGWARDRNANLSQADIRSEGYSGLQVFNVEVELLESDPDRLREGFRAIVDFPIQLHRDVLAIPREAVQIRRGQATVCVREGGDTVTRPVVLGPESRDRVIVREGLREGESVYIPPTIEEQKSLSSETRSGVSEGPETQKRPKAASGGNEGRRRDTPAAPSGGMPGGGDPARGRGGR